MRPARGKDADRVNKADLLKDSDRPSQADTRADHPQRVDLLPDADFLKAEERILSEERTAVDLLEELVQIPTVNPPGDDYLECALLLAERLRDLGFEPQVVDLPPHERERLRLRTNAPRPSVLATLEPGEHEAHDGSAAEDALAASGRRPLHEDVTLRLPRPTLHFHGHYDVVPAPSPSLFRLTRDGDRIFGRGTADMKGGIVSMMLALSALRPLKDRLRGRVLLSLVPDEETGGEAGTAYLFRAGVLTAGGLGMLMPEPAGSTIWNGNRGALSLLLTVKGKSAHVAVQHQGVNAFEGLLELGAMFRELKGKVESRVFGSTTHGAEEPASVLLIGGVSRGGTNFNIVPDEAQFSLDRRFHPEETPAEVEKEIDAIVRAFRRRGWKVEVEELQRGDASLTPPDLPFARALAQSIASVTGTESRFELCPGILETRFFLRHGIPGLAYGPGELAYSHQPNEHVRLSRILEVARVYARMAWDMVGPAA